MAQALRAEAPVSLLYVGSRGGVEERLVERAGIPFVGVPAGGIHGLGPAQAVRNMCKLLEGWKVALELGRRERPAALFATGGYASIPVALAAWTLRVPILLYLPDIEPGWAVRFIARLATKVAVTVEQSQGYFPARKVMVTGYPVRAEFYGVERARARASLQLASDGPVLLVMGGSRGASRINQALNRVLELVLELAQVVHLSGELDWPAVQARYNGLPAALQARYHPYPYLHEIWLALAAADLVLCRAGASTLGELPFFALPALLVPYPHAWRYQRTNAAWLTERGAALQVEDERLEEELLPALRGLLSDQSVLEEMKARMRALARPDAAARLAGALYALAARDTNGRDTR
ncbi:MAG: UDP-N-acetylglucosamine--N-acetylmuramyl-(pentapeptide) pyrophosphoryl-undecaprenol N-acetylglucosamine transferase [Anaerolineae bacterium]|nr:UDP-N-acetylglucosamine--N-acetylmuramyl-(pentapeptide) pyrophosphoryl-undecaprenol N-acetylglucosamine transferase [Anaerolineae bacterium]